MKISTFRRLNIEDFKDLPEEMQSFFQALNPIIEELVDALRGQITMGDNVRAKIVKVKVADATDTVVSVTGIGRPVAAFLSAPAHATLAWRVVDDDRCSINVDFAVAPSGTTEVSVLFVGS